MTNTENKSEQLFSELFLENEIKTNRLASQALLALGLLFIFFNALDIIKITNLGIGLCRQLMILSGILDILFYALAKHFHNNTSWLKWALLFDVLLSSGVLFFFFPLNASFLTYGPIIISAMYFSLKLIRRTALISWLLYSAILWGNVILEKSSSLIHDFHAFQGITLWQIPKEVLVNYFIPHTFLFTITYFICSGITKKGRRLVEKQALISTEAAEAEAEIKAASEIQLSSLPDSSFRTADGNIVLDAFIRPAKTAGGDFYDYFVTSTNVIFLVADVSDKGLSAAMFTMKAKNAIHSAFRNRKSLEDAISAANTALCFDNNENMFVTLWIASLNVSTGVGRFINCGHPYPIVKHRDSSVTVIENAPSPPLGIFNDIEFPSYPLQLKPGDTLFVFTDGLTDAENSSGSFFGNNRLLESIKSSHCENLCEKVISTIDSFVNDVAQFDDMTALCLQMRHLRGISRKELRLNTAETSSDKVIDNINALLKRKACPEAVRQSIDVVLDEICTNISDYAYPDSNGDYSITATAGSNFLDLLVIDSGIPFNPIDADGFSDPLENGENGGFGIHLVKSIMDVFNYKRADGKNHLHLMKIWN